MPSRLNLDGWVIIVFFCGTREGRLPISTISTIGEVGSENCLTEHDSQGHTYLKEADFAARHAVC